MIELKTLKYLDVLEVLKDVEASSGRRGLMQRVWTHLQDTDYIHRDSMIYVNTEDDFDDSDLGQDLEAIKQAVSHIPLEEINWYATW